MYITRLALSLACVSFLVLGGCDETPVATQQPASPTVTTNATPAMSVGAEQTPADGFCGAVTAGNMELVVDLLDDNPTLINANDRDGWSPLHWAISTNNKQMAAFLIDKGADVNAKTPKGWTPLHRAAFEGSKDLAELLIAKGALINAPDNEGMTPLHWAANEGKRDVVALLVAKGADVTLKEKYNRTAGKLASKKGYKDIAATLGVTVPTMPATPATTPAK